MSTQVNNTNASVPPLPDAHYAAKTGKLETLEEASPEQLNEQASDGSYPLHWAASSNSWRATQFLVKHCSLDALGPMDTTALHWAVRAGYVYTTHLLLQSGANAFARDSQKYTPLHVAVHSSNVLMVIYLLHAEQPADANARDATGKTPLHWAAYQGDHLSVLALLRSGADPNARDNDGFIALHWALVSRSRGCIEQLVAAKSDLTLKNNHGKGCDVIAVEMDSVTEWHAALAQLGLSPSLKPARRWFSRFGANVLLFLLPFVLCPVTILLLESKRTALLAPVLAYLVKKFCDVFVYPCIQVGPGALVISTALAGIYNGMFFWIFVVYFSVVLPATWTLDPLANTALTALAAVVLLMYGYTAIVDAGTVKSGNVGHRRQVIYSLIELGLYDGDHFDVNTWAPKPARAQYSRHMNAVVARFDHYCPWVYNAVGLKNHRTFMLYLTSLSVALGIYFYLFFSYLGLGGALWESALASPFVSLMSLGIFFQGCWIVLLTLTQYVQIARGMTTSEFQHGPSFSFTSLPKDHPVAMQRPELVPEVRPEVGPSHAHKHRKGFLGTCLKLLGVTQAVQTSKRLKTAKRPSFGVWTNCTDFWCADWNVFSRKGSGRSNGRPFDYMTQWEPAQVRPGTGAETALRGLV